MAVPKLRFKAFADEWGIYKIKDFYDFKNGLNKEKEFFGKGTPIVNYMDVNKNRHLYHDNIKGLVTLTNKEIENYNVKKNDLFFTRTSETSQEIGLCAAMLDDIKNCVFSGFVLRARPRGNNIAAKFASYAFTTSAIREEIIKKSSITTRALTSGTSLNEVIIKIPTLPEQQKIADFFSLLDRKITLHEKKIALLKDYKKGVFDKVLKSSKMECTKRLDQAVEVVKGQQLNKTDMTKDGCYYVLNGGIVPSGYTTNYNTTANTISISEGGNSCGFVNFNSHPFWSGGHCYTLKHTSTFNYKYIYFYLKHYEKIIMAMRVGSGLPNIQKKILSAFEISYPNRARQNSISNFMVHIELLEDKNSKKLTLLTSLKQALLQQIFV